jgi:hypothetical protein
MTKDFKPRKTYNFHENFVFSEGIEEEGDLVKYLLDMIPGSIEFKRASESDDKEGTDYWIVRKPGLQSVKVDIKKRRFDPIEKLGKDDVCIETTSVYIGKDNYPWSPPWLDNCRIKIGWTLDDTKNTDLVVYTWPREDGRRRFWVVYFPHLCRAAQKNWRIWAKKYGEVPTDNEEYREGRLIRYYTLNVYPLRKEVIEAINELISGTALMQKMEPPKKYSGSLYDLVFVNEDNHSAEQKQRPQEFSQERLF